MTEFIPMAVQVTEASIPIILAEWPYYAEEALRTDLMKDVTYVFVKNVELSDAIASACVMTQKTFDKSFQYKDTPSDSALTPISYL